MLTAFDRAVEFVLEHEGGYGHDPDDPGGETNFGISKRAYPHEDIRNMTEPRARALYRRDYWDACRCDLLPWPLSLAVFDGAVQHGPRRVVEMLQDVLDVPLDGEVGPMTLGALRGRAPAEVFDELLATRAALYDAIDRRLRGWWRRLLACHRLGIETSDG